MNNVVLRWCIVCAVLLFFLATCVLLLKQNMALRASLADAANQVRFQEMVREATDSVLTSQLEKENEIRSQRKELEEKLDEAACLSGPAYIDALVELLDEDHKNRCR